MAKLTIEFNDRMTDALNRVAARDGISKVEALRRALALYDYAKTETTAEQTRRLSITQDGKVLRDIILTG